VEINRLGVGEIRENPLHHGYLFFEGQLPDQLLGGELKLPKQQGVLGADVEKGAGG